MKRLQLLSVFTILLGIGKMIAQPANTCPSVNAGTDQTICSGCANLTQTFLPVNATTAYTVGSVPYLPYSYTTNPTTGTTPASGLPTSSDDYWGPAVNIGFCFEYYGNTYTQCIMGANGAIGFNTANATLGNTWPISAGIPSTTPADMKNTIMGPWHDIDPAVTPPSGTSDLYYYTTGSAPCRKFVAIWHNCPMFSCTTEIDQQEIVLYETTNIIEVYIQSKPLCTGWNGGLAVLGIQNAAGTAAVTVPGRNATQWTATNEGWRFTPSGAPQYSLQWLQGATVLGTTATVSVCPTATTTYTAKETVTTCAGPISFTDDVIVNVNSTTPAPATAPVTYCQGAVASPLTATPSGGGTLNWYGTNSTGGTASGTAPTPSTATPGTVDYYVSQTIGGCEGPRGIIAVTVNPSPTVTVNSPTICAGSTASLTAGGATSYTWSAGATSTGVNTANASPGSTTTYTVTGTSLGCSATAIATVTVNPHPTVTVNSLTICAGATATLTAGGATSYTWSAGATSTGTNTATATPGTTTTYTVTGTSSGCTGTAVSTVTVNPVPVTTVNSPTICPTQTATLTAGGATSYTWSAGATSTGVNTADATPATTTTYTVTGTSSGCTSTAVATVTIGGSITPTVNSPTICNGSTATLTAGGATSYTWTAGATPTGVNTATATPTTTTSYTVTGTSGGCTGTAVSTVIVNPIPVTTVNAPTVCNGISASLTAGGATSYAWSPGATPTGVNTATATPSSTTTYTVTGTSLGCSSTAGSTVIVNPIPVTTVNSPTICPTTTANLVAGGATSYTWTAGTTVTGTNTADATPTITTSYTVTGTSSGCTSTAVSTVTISPGITITVNSPTICAGQTATLTAGGATSYTWTAGATSTGTATADASPAITTTYTVTGTTSGCTGTAVATVTVNSLPVTTVNSPTICNGITTNLTAGGATSYTWTAGATVTGTNTADATPATTTTYTVTGTTSSCTSTAVSTVIVNPIPVTTVNSPSICTGTTAGLIAGGATSYTWSAGATSTGVNTADATPGTTTTYTVTGTSLSCSSTAVATVTINSGLTPSAGLDDSVCFGASTTLNVTPNGAGYTYSWAPAASLSNSAIFNPIASPATTTTYSVTVTSAAGCTGTSTVTIYADPQITMAIAGINVTCFGACNGQTIVIPGGGAGGFSYNWTSGCTGASCTGLCPGTYTVTVTDSWGCTTTADTSVTQPTLLTASVTTTTPASCNGVCDGTATAAGAGGTIGAGYSYSWNTSPVQTTAAATGLCAGVYTCTVTDANGCTATTTATITEPSLVVIAPITNLTICNGGTTTITAAAAGGNTGGYTYQWTPTGTGTTASVTVTPATTTVYTVTAFDIAHSCPSAPVNVTVTVNPPLAVIASGTAAICPGAATPINAVASLGGGSTYTYSWLPTTGLSNPAIANPTASPATTTTYTVTANDGCSPSVTATVTVTVLPLPVVNFTANNTSGCSPLCVTFADNSTVTGGAIASWNWTFDGITDATSSPSHCFTTPGSYSVGLTVTSSLGGCTSTATNTNMITVYANPIASFTAPSSVSIIDPLATFTDNSTNAASWSWNFNDPFATSTNNTSSLQNPTHNYSEVGTYCVTLTVTSPNGCVDSIPVCLVVDPEFTFFIPNAFSPNGDGINDEFFGKGDFVTDFEMSIFDRWGNLIFFADDINKHWDGKANHGSEVAEQDVYVYVVKLKDNKDRKHKYIGTVTIVK